ncbi:MAG: hypothetical protein EZS28_029654 [Streblomastix strix]|uniref:Uncharacterized protein n=1 Tax=Streblomastix strix TaxID=222440 RepID=A0A5J4UWH7_9EUKA|nr:MAG: hypothetical protein EZS28_029654 [Streblomastix strix]
MQEHNYQQSPELAPSGPAEGSPELQPEQGGAHDVRADYQVNLRHQKLKPEIIKEGRNNRDIVRNAILQSRPFAQRIRQDTQIGLQNEEIIVFRLPYAGARGDRTIPSLKKHIMRREIRYIDPEKNNQNLCFFLVYSFITMQDIKVDVAADGSAIADKRYKEHSRIAEAKRLFQRIYGKKIDDNYNSYKYLLAHGREDEFKPTKYYITYDIETVERIVNEKFGDNSTQISILELLSIASTIKIKKKVINGSNNGSVDQIYSIYFDIRTSNFINVWIKQLFKEARKVIHSNKYEDETIPQHYEVPVIGFNSSKFDVALILKNLQSDEWQIIKYLGSVSNAKQIIVKHNISGIKLRSIDAMIYSTKMKLKQLIKDFTPKASATTEKSEIPTKLKFPYEFINYDNYVQELDKSEPFPQEAFRNSIKNKNINIFKYQNYLAVAQQFSNRWDYLRHYNLQDTRLMIEPLDYLIDMFFNYKIDMLQFMSMSACANAIKYALAYWDFKLDQDYMPKDDYAPFILTQNFQNIKVQNYLEQDKKRNRDTSNNIKESDCAFYRKLFLSTGCHICKARFTSKNRPTLDRINNDRCHSADGPFPTDLIYIFSYVGNH